MMKLAAMVRGDTKPANSVVAVEHDRVLTRSDARAAVALYAAQLRERGVRPGQQVVALLDHDARAMFFLAAASALGLRVVIPYNLAAALPAEWAAIAAHARPDHIVTLRADADARAVARWGSDSVVALGDFESATRSADWSERDEVDESVDSFLVLFTSGSTGSPKAIAVSEELICRRIAAVTRRLKFHARARVFMSGLMTNTTGVIFSFGALHHDGVVIFPATRAPELWPAEVAAHRATHIMLRPGAMRLFVDSARSSSADVSSLEVMAYGSAPAPRALLEEGRQLMRCDWIQGYGLSETYGPFCWLDEQAHTDGRMLRGTYCVGVPDDTVEIALLPLDGAPPAQGEVAVRADNIMEGYYDFPTGGVNAIGRWLRTGDVGEWSPDGDLLLKGRISDSVLSGNGHRIYPEEVETVLGSISGVDEAVLVAMPRDDGFGETPVACIQGALAHRSPAAIGQTVSAALDGVLSPEKWPAFVCPATRPFARNANDKILRRDVVAQIDAEALIPMGVTDERVMSR